MGDEERAENADIAVTPEMIAAGISAVCAADDYFETDAMTAARIYRAMEMARLKEREDASGPSQLP